MKRMLCLTIATLIFAFTPAKVTIAVNEKGICVDCYEGYASDENISINTLNPFKSGTGWGSAWSEGDREGFDSYITEIEAQITPPCSDGIEESTLKINNLAAGLYRKLGSEVDFSQDGEYFVKILLHYDFEAEKAENHCLQMFLGDSIIFGSEKLNDGIFAYVSTDGGKSKKYAERAIDFGKSYDIILHILSDSDGEDRLSLTYNYVGNEADKPLLKLDKAVSSNEAAGYFGIKDNEGIGYRVREIRIESYNTELNNLGALEEIKGAVEAASENPNEETLKNAQRKLSKLSADSCTKKFYSDSLPDRLFLSEKLFSADGKSFSATLVNTGIKELHTRLFMVCYKDNKLEAVTAKDYKLTDSGVNARLSGTENSNSDVRVYLWDDKCVPVETVIKPENISYNKLYVKPGSTNGVGSFEKPFSSITEARDYLRSHKTEPYIVYLMGGSYYTDSQIIFDSRDSRSKNNRVVYQAYGHEKPVLTGGKSISASDFVLTEEEKILSLIPEKAHGKVMQTDLSKFNFSFASELPTYGHSEAYLNDHSISHNNNPDFFLMCGDEMMINARWPNSGYALVSKVVDEGSMAERRGFSFRFDNEEKLKQWENANDMAVHGYWNYNYSDFATPAYVDTQNSSITTIYPSGKGVSKNRQFYVYNLLEELDSEGEYYIDRENNILYFYPPAGFNEALLVAQQYSMLRIKDVANTEFNGIEILGTRGRGFDLENCSNILLNDITVNGTGLWGIYLNDCTDCTVMNSNIINNGYGGIYASGGSLLNEEEGNIRILNNSISNFSQLKKCYSYGVSVEGWKNWISGNTIFNAPQQAVTIGGNDNVFCENEIYNVLNEASDMGAVYMGKSKIARGNIIENNYFHDMSSSSVISPLDIQAIYLDDLIDGYTIRNNTFENIKGAAVTISGGRANSVYQNLFINNSKNVKINAVGIEYQSKYKEYIEGLCEKIASGYYSPEIYSRYPNFLNIADDEPYEPKHNIVKDNIMYGCNEDIVFSAHSIYGDKNIIKNNTLEPSAIAAENFREE